MSLVRVFVSVLASLSRSGDSSDDAANPPCCDDEVIE